MRRAWMRWSWPVGLNVQGIACPSACASDAPLKSILVRRAHDTSGSSSSGTTTLKGELRRLYKLIHPDLLHNQPEQQATNQKSFQLLQEYLTTAKGGDGSKRFIYHFEFFIRSNASSDSLEKVEVSLPPPQTRGRNIPEHDILPATRRAIEKLFTACGLSTNLTDVEERLSLPELFQEASELQRQAEGSQLNLQQQLSLISNALFIGRGAKVLFRAPVEEAHLEIQVQLLERLANAMDRVTGVDFRRSTFVLGNSYKVDFLGRLWLNSDDDIEVWVQFLHQVDLITSSSRRVAAKARQLKEEKVAQFMGVDFIFTDDSLALQPEYSSLLQRIEEGATGHGAVGSGRFSELPIRASKVDRLSIDEDSGFLVLPVTEDFKILYKFIDQNGDKALEYRRKFKLRESRLEDLRKHVRIKLRLRHLKFDRKLSPEQLMSACTRLSSHAPRLTNYTEGLSLCISDEDRLPSDATGYFVHMKWNFSPQNL